MQIIDILPFSEFTFALQIAKPKFINKQQLKTATMGVPYPYFKNDNVVNFYKDVYVIPYSEKYYHNMMEIWTNILYLKNKNIKFKLIVVIDDPRNYDPVERVPYGWKNDGGVNMFCFRQLLENNDIDYICYPRDSKEYLEMCPRSAYIFFDRNDVLYTDHLRKCYPKELYFKNFTGHEPCVSHKPEGLYNRVEMLMKWAPKYKMKNNKIYITRKNYEDRSLRDEEILINYLKECGYTIINFEDYPVLEQIRIVQESSHIIVQSGSSLFNCMFANPETKIFEIETNLYPVGIYEDVFNMYNMQWTRKKYPSNHSNFLVNELKKDIWFQDAFVAQRTEQDSSKVLVAGSTPAEGASDII